MGISNLADEELAVLGQDTYDKQQWLEADVRTLRECWDEYQRRGEDTITFFRPAYSHVLTFHEIESGEVGLEDIRLLERAGAGIASDYREVMRKLRAVSETKSRPSPDRTPPSRIWSAPRPSFNAAQRH